MGTSMKTRTMKFEGNEYKYTTPMRAIRAKCIDCSGGDMREVRLCPSKTCELYPFRMGTNPFMSGLHKESTETNAQQTEHEEQSVSSPKEMDLPGLEPDLLGSRPHRRRTT